MGNRILGQDRQTVARDEFGNAVVDFRVDVVRPTAEDDAPAVVLLQPAEGFLPLPFHIGPETALGLPGFMGSVLHLLSGNVRELFPEDLHELVGENLLRGESHEGVQEADLSACDLLDIVLDILGVAGDDRAVIVIVGVGEFIPLVGNAGVEDEVHALVYEPLDVAVGDLRRVAGILRGNGLNAQLVDLPRGPGRKDGLELEVLEEDGPEGVVLVHIENPRQAHGPADSLFIGQGLIVGEEALPLVVVEVRNIVLLLGKAQAPLAAVSGDEFSPVREVVDGE